VDSLSGVKSLLVYLPISLLAWQFSRQFAIVLRCGLKERALVKSWSGCLIGKGSAITRFVFGAFGGQASLSV
ncbi:hypothetical protein OFC55_35765, partial [Escherichia coli]|nr:hypothetical protein [Escherichia coli]